MNFTNQTEYLVDENLFLRIGSSWALDTIYVVVIAPLGFIGILFNLICFCTLHKIKVKIKEIKLYKYLKVYSLAGVASCLILGLAFMTYSPRYFKDFIHPIVKFYRCHIITYVMICFFFYINLLDILISMDRMAIFTDKISFFRKICPYMSTFILLFACFIINLPLLFGFETSNDQVFFSSNAVNYCSMTEFGKSRLGIISNIIVILIRDVLTFILEIITSTFVLYFYRTYKNNPILLNNIFVNDIQAVNDNMTPRLHKMKSRINYRQQKYRKLLLMTFLLSIISILSHFLAAIVYVFTLKLIDEIIFLHFSFVCLGIFCFSLKNFLNIFIFYFFNSNFQEQFNKMFLFR